MKKQFFIAIILSIIVIVATSTIILSLEPSKATVPYYHDKTANEVSEFLLSLTNGTESTELLFNDLIDVEDDTLKYVFGIEPTYLEAYSVKTSTTNASTFLVLRLKSGSKSIIEQSVIDYMSYLEEKWQDIDSEQATLVQNYSKIAMEDYLIYVVSENNEYIKEKINSFFIYTDAE